VALPSHRRDHLVDERRLQRHRGDHGLDRGAFGLDRLHVPLARRGGAALVIVRLAEARDLVLVTADPRERE
jgi:hypothetical protein